VAAASIDRRSTDLARLSRPKEQGMTHDVDHLVLAVGDLDVASGSFEKAGFLVTPRADHPFGTSNRLVVFDSTYIELVGVTRPSLIPDTGFAAAVAERVANGRGGLSHVVLKTTDAAATTGRFGGELFEFSRPAPAIDGTTQTASFTLVMLAETDPGFFFCAHHNPASVWHPSHRAHANGASRLINVGVRRPRPALSPIEVVTGVEFEAAHDSIGTNGRYTAFDVEGITFTGSVDAP
jgi:hypothetical protein